MTVLWCPSGCISLWVDWGHVLFPRVLAGVCSSGQCVLLPYVHSVQQAPPRTSLIGSLWCKHCFPCVSDAMCRPAVVCCGFQRFSEGAPTSAQRLWGNIGAAVWCFHSRFLWSGRTLSTHSATVFFYFLFSCIFHRWKNVNTGTVGHTCSRVSV